MNAEWLKPLAAALFAASPAAAAPAIWVVRDADSTMYVMGAMHSTPPDSAWRTPLFEKAYDEADEIWTETEPGDFEEEELADVRMGYDYLNARLPTLLGPSDYQRLLKILEEAGYRSNLLDYAKPWFALDLVEAHGVFDDIPEEMRPHADAYLSVERIDGPDREARTRGEKDGKRLRALETVASLRERRAAVPEGEMTEMLRAALSPDWSAPAKIHAAWVAGDLAGVEAVVITPMRARYPAYWDLYVRGRNRAWIEVLAREMDGSGTDLVLAGAAHFVGEDNVIVLLEARGFRVERIQ